MIFEESSVQDFLSEGTETQIGNQIIAEGIIMDAMQEAGVTALDEDVMLDLLQENLLSERNIIKFDKKTKRKHNANRAVIVIAKEKNDRDYKKLVKVYKMRKVLLARLQAKYGTKAKVRARQMEKSGSLSNAIAKIKKGSVKRRDL
jgi:hypothetical protein